MIVPEGHYAILLEDYSFSGAVDQGDRNNSRMRWGIGVNDDGCCDLDDQYNFLPSIPRILKRYKRKNYFY